MIEESEAWSFNWLPGAWCVNGDGTEATFSIGGRNLQYRFHSSADRKFRDSARLSRFRCPGGS